MGLGRRKVSQGSVGERPHSTGILSLTRQPYRSTNTSALGWVGMAVNSVLNIPFSSLLVCSHGFMPEIARTGASRRPPDAFEKGGGLTLGRAPSDLPEKGAGKHSDGKYVEQNERVMDRSGRASSFSSLHCANKEEDSTMEAGAG